jgi:hypothetical protein
MGKWSPSFDSPVQPSLGGREERAIVCESCLCLTFADSLWVTVSDDVLWVIPFALNGVTDSFG